VVGVAAAEFLRVSGLALSRIRMTGRGWFSRLEPLQR
jgi:hypothetical protein